MSNSTAESRMPQDARGRATRETRENRELSENARQPVKPPRRRRANDITNAIGLTPITGLSGPKIAY